MDSGLQKLIAVPGPPRHSGGLDALFQHIDERLRLRKFCVVFDNELQRVWPVEEKERAKRAGAIEAFAKAHSLTATIHDPGIRVTFRRAFAGAESKADGQLVTVG